MAWMLSFSPPREPELLEELLLAAGKALCVANHFESACKYVLTIITRIEAHEAGETFDAASELVRKVEKKMLAQAVDRIGRDPQVTPADLAVLNAARDARNYVAHEGATLGSLDASARAILDKMSALRLRVEELAKGEALASRWCYEIDEKDGASGFVTGQYVDRLVDWVFGGPPILNRAFGVPPDILAAAMRKS